MQTFRPISGSHVIIFFMLNSAEHEILNSHKYKNIKKFNSCWHFNIYEQENFMLCWVEHEISFIASRPGCSFRNCLIWVCNVCLCLSFPIPACLYQYLPVSCLCQNKTNEKPKDQFVPSIWPREYFKYSRTSMARTLMTRLPRLFRSHS